MFTRSPSGAISAICTPASLSTGTDSPVSADSSTCRLAADNRRQSAGTRSPASNSTTSPGTRSVAFMLVSTPSRQTLAAGADRFFSASSAACARLS